VSGSHPDLGHRIDRVTLIVSIGTPYYISDRHEPVWDWYDLFILVLVSYIPWLALQQLLINPGRGPGLHLAGAFLLHLFRLPIHEFVSGDTPVIARQELLEMPTLDISELNIIATVLGGSDIAACRL
jgi:hypothetical protein